jgi:hypothetical protein
MVDKYFVYVFLDPRHPGKYEFVDYSFLYQPIYIGKGSGYRLTAHMCASTRKKNHPFYNKVNKIIKECGHEPYVIKLRLFCNEEDAFEYEQQFIHEVTNQCSDYLTNLSSGGKNTTHALPGKIIKTGKRTSKLKGVPRTNEVKKKISQTKLKSHPRAKNWLVIDSSGKKHKTKSLRQLIEGLGYTNNNYKALINCHLQGNTKIKRGKLKDWEVYELS